MAKGEVVCLEVSWWCCMPKWAGVKAQVARLVGGVDEVDIFGQGTSCSTPSSLDAQPVYMLDASGSCTTSTLSAVSVRSTLNARLLFLRVCGSCRTWPVHVSCRVRVQVLASNLVVGLATS